MRKIIVPRFQGNLKEVMLKLMVVLMLKIAMDFSTTLCCVLILEPNKARI